MNSNGYPLASTFEDGITTNDMVSLDDTAKIELGENKISLIADDIEISGHIVSGGDIYADRFILNDSPDPPQILLSDGTTAAALPDSEFIFTASQPTNNINDISKSKGDVWMDGSNNLYGFQPPFKSEPQERVILYTFSDFNVGSEGEFIDALTAEIPPNTIRQLTLTANINFTNIKNINGNIKITSDATLRTITLSSAGNIINFTGNLQIVDRIGFTNVNTGSNANCLGFSSTTASNNYVTNCIFTTNEFAITSSNAQIQITDNTFLFTGAGDSHRYIALYKNTGNTFISRNTFQGNPTFNTACVLIGVLGSSLWTNGNFIYKNNTTSAPVQRLCISEASFGVNDNVKFWIHDNTIQSSSGFMIFYSLIPMTGVYSIVAYNNTETLGGTAVGSKGIIGLDYFSATTLPDRNGPPYITTFDNVQPALRADYTGWTSDNNVAYNSTIISVAGNTPKLYSPVLQDTLAGSSISDKTANINSVVNNVSTSFTGAINADSIIKTGGTNQQYLMANGSVLQYSANSGNSNFYLYKSSQSLSDTPTAGHINYNNANQSLASIIYISHLTDDSIDIEVFFKQLSTLNEVYIQDRSLSESFIQYDIIGSPTITVDSKVAIPVTVRSAGGAGTTSFGNNHQVLLSFFTNNIETDTRLSTLESKTQNLLATGSDNTFTRTLKMGNNTIQGLAFPVNTGDAANKSYVDNGDASRLPLAGGTLTGALNIAGAVNPRLGTADTFNVTAADGVTGRFRVSNTGVISLVTMSMNNNILSGLPAPVSNDDAVNKLYADTKVPKTGNTSITGEITATKLIKSGGTATQFLMANGDSNSKVYPEITSGTFNLLWSGSAGGASSTQSISVTYKLTSDGSDKIVFLRFGLFSVTQGTTVQNFISATGLPTELIPTGAGINDYIPFSIAGSNSIGLFTIFAPSGLIHLRRSDTANLVAGTVYGTGGVATVSYFI